MYMIFLLGKRPEQVATHKSWSAAYDTVMGMIGEECTIHMADTGTGSAMNSLWFVYRLGASCATIAVVFTEE